jgi:hypothetical protein
MNPHHQASMQAEELLLLFLELFFTPWWCFFASSYKVDKRDSSNKSDERASSRKSNERACSSKQLVECIQREKEGRKVCEGKIFTGGRRGSDGSIVM